jgi:hypothetical protein
LKFARFGQDTQLTHSGDPTSLQSQAQAVDFLLGERINSVSRVSAIGGHPSQASSMPLTFTSNRPNLCPDIDVSRTPEDHTTEHRLTTVPLKPAWQPQHGTWYPRSVSRVLTLALVNRTWAIFPGHPPRPAIIGQNTLRAAKSLLCRNGSCQVLNSVDSGLGSRVKRRLRREGGRSVSRWRVCLVSQLGHVPSIRDLRRTEDSS